LVSVSDDRAIAIARIPYLCQNATQITEEFILSTDKKKKKFFSFKVSEVAIAPDDNGKFYVYDAMELFSFPLSAHFLFLIPFF
jgi:hypothetical protein